MLDVGGFGSSMVAEDKREEGDFQSTIKITKNRDGIGRERNTIIGLGQTERIGGG